jgi:hypothetical protein
MHVFIELAIYQYITHLNISEFHLISYMAPYFCNFELVTKVKLCGVHDVEGTNVRVGGRILCVCVHAYVGMCACVHVGMHACMACVYSMSPIIIRTYIR